MWPHELVKIAWREYYGKQVAYYSEHKGNCKYFRDGAREPYVLRKLNELIRPGDMFLDAGAHIGQETIPVSELIDPGIVVACDPDVLHTMLLSLSLDHNKIKNVIVLPVALAYEWQPVRYELDDCGGAMIGTGAGMAWTVPLDALGFRFDGAKIDIQGNEIALLSGGEKSLSAARFIIVETHGDHTYRQILESWGFVLAEINGIHDLFLKGETDVAA